MKKSFTLMCILALSLTTVSTVANTVTVDGATSYKLYHSTSAEGVYSELASPATNSYNWTGLTASTTYYVKVSAVNGVGESDLSDPISFTTLAPHIHDDITFTIYDNLGGGILTGFVESNVGASENYATSLIVVKSGGELVLKQGTILLTLICKMSAIVTGC